MIPWTDATGIYCFFFCFGSMTPPPATPAPDTYCAVYRRVVETEEELTSIQTVPRPVRDRIQSNDLYYKCKCMGWRAPECSK